MKTKEQLRAERANGHVAAVKADVLSSYAAELRGFSAMLLRNGLGASLAFLRSTGTPAQAALYEHLSNWVGETVHGQPKADLLWLVVAADSSKLLRAHDEALAYCTWLRRFADAREIGGKKP